VVRRRLTQRTQGQQAGRAAAPELAAIIKISEPYHLCVAGGLRFTYFNTGGQDFVLGYHSPEELASIRESTGLDIVWLNA
jgi:hypothetical protein